MEKAAVVIPTIASKRTKRPVSRGEEIRLWGKMIRQVIINSAKSVSNTGFTPAIVVVNNFKANEKDPRTVINQNMSDFFKTGRKITDTLEYKRRKSIERELKKLSPEIYKNVHIIERPGAGWMGSVLQGSQFAVDQLRATAVVSMADDFETEAKQIGRLLEPLRRKDPGKRADFVFARWKQFGHTFPPAQFIKERIGSMLVNFANSRVAIRPGEDFLEMAQRSGRESVDVQSQSGLMAMNARTFLEANRFIQEYFSGANFGHSGLDPVLHLAVLRDTHVRMEGVDFPRKFEHFYPRSQREQQGLVASRKGFFEGAEAGVKRFLEVTGQTAKIARLAEARELLDQQTRSAPRTWKPGSRKKLVGQLWPRGVKLLEKRRRRR